MKYAYGVQLKEANKSLMSALAFALLVLLIGVYSIADAAKQPKVDVCHNTGNGSYHLINISANAVDKHIANHGDGLVGEAVPGMEGYLFAEDCSLVIAGPEVEEGYNENATLEMGARWRNFRTDGNGWELAVGDPANIGTYNPGWTSTDFTYAGDYFFSPDMNTFTLTYDGTTFDQTVVAEVSGGTFSATQNNGDLGMLDYMQINVVGRNGQTVNFGNVTLTTPAGTFDIGNFSAGGWLDWQINDFDFSQGFTLSGNVELVGQATSQEGSKINIYIGHDL